MIRVRHYIFDLYGTLIDIRTDEHDGALWRAMAEYYAAFGADWTPEAMERRFFALTRERESALAGEAGRAYPEIDLGDVFSLLYTDAPGKHPAALRPPEDALPRWCEGAASMFRILSRKRFGLFAETLSVLRALRARGCRIHLLSNAQRVFTLPELETTGLTPLFDSVYLSSEHGMRKPQPEFMARLLKAERIDPADAVMIGNDFDTDMRIAAALGIRGVLLNTDGYSGAELRRRRDALRPAEIELIASGDIGELLSLSSQ